MLRQKVFRPQARTTLLGHGMVMAGILGGLLAGLWSSCVAVKPFQRKYLNDSQMRLGKTDISAFDESAQTYREGASGGGNGKASGGCACN